MSKKEELKRIREKIDELDTELLNLINQRASLAIEAGETKKKEVIYKPEREADILRKLKKTNSGPLNEQQISNIFKEIISSCRAQEDELDVAFLGPEGTYSESAVKKNFGSSVSKSATETIEEVFKDVAEGKSDYGIVPIENSTEGPINQTLDCLADFNLNICGEVEMLIHHSLMGLNQAFPKEGFEIHAHEQTLAQCKNWLDAHCPDVKRVPVSSNAQAAKNAKDNSGILAIAGSLASEKYGLEIIRRNIEDYSENTTRFIVIGFQEVSSTGEDKTSLLVTTKNESGALYNLLKPIQKNGLNLTHITYRPSKINKWHYSFFFDFEGHKDDKKVKSLLDELSATNSEIKLLGSYPNSVK
jgi:chorismate mutase/prephenate dehydratase